MFFCECLGLPPALAFYPLNYRIKGRDVSPKKNPTGRLSNVKYERGPDNNPGGSIRFRGRPNSYVEFPKKKRAPSNEITVLAYVFPEGGQGPILSNANPHGVGIRVYSTKKGLIASFTSPRKPRTSPVRARRLRPRTWSFVATTYNRRTGIAKIFINAREVARKRIGKLRVPTSYPLRTGAVRRDARRLRGKVTCIQIYPKELTSRQIRMAQRLCFKRGKCTICMLKTSIVLLCPNCFNVLIIYVY